MGSYTPSSFEAGSMTDKFGASQPQYTLVKTDAARQPSLDLDENDADNPRKWGQRKKVALGCFVLLAAFVA